MRRFKGAEPLERASFLDPAIAPVKRTASAIRRGRWGDALHGLWLGHPAHPLFVQVPMGAWVSSAVLDVLPGYEKAARRLIQLGLTAALPAVATGAADWSQQNPRQARVGFLHALFNGTGVVLYGASLLARANGRNRGGRLLSYAGLAAVSVGGYLGGHIAYRQLGGVSRAEGLIRVFPGEWLAACSVADLPDRQLARRRVEGFDLLLFRSGERVHALIDTCSHLAGPLSEGTVVDEGGGTGLLVDACVRCPLHGSTFRLHNGEVVRGPATAPQPTLRTRVRDGLVEVCRPG